MTAVHRYSIEPIDPAAHNFEVTVTVAEPDPAGQAFTMPAWVPGSYLIRDFARNVLAIRAESGGEPVELLKTDKSTWQAAPCGQPLKLIAEIHANDLSVRGAHLDTTHGFFDGATMFPCVVGQEGRECELDIRPPPETVGADWRVATSMCPAGAERYGFGTYRAADYAELLDHPVEMGRFLIGEFEAAGIPHAIAVTAHKRFDMARICHDLATLCEAQLAFLGPPADLDRYLFLLSVTENGYGGLEHRWSSSLICARRDLPQRKAAKTGDDYRKFLGLCSHEYFHLWNVKRMKPERFTPYDLSREVHTGLLWVFEGITSYYDKLYLVRSGLISAESYLELLGRTITRVMRGSGRLRQSVEESSFDAWTRFYKQDANSPNAIVSYYAKGSLIALALDMTIRKESHGEHSLDDVMREAWARYGESGEGMPERGLEAVARSVTGLELEDFFDRYVRGTGDIPLQGLLRTVGVRLNARAASDGKDMGGKPAAEDALPPPWLGASLAQDGAESRFRVVHADSPAEKAGIAPGDEAVALAGLRLNADNLDSRLRDYQAGDRVTITVFRDHRLMNLKVRLGQPPEDTYYLVMDAEADEAADERAAWLGRSENSEG
jgi:predicted metalloprotease with PDZ domain